MVYQCVGPLRVLADLADRLLVPTFSTEPDVSCAFGRDRRSARQDWGEQVQSWSQNSQHGLLWQQRRREDLKRFGDKKHLLYVDVSTRERDVKYHAFNARTSERLRALDCGWWSDSNSTRARGERSQLPVVFWGFQRGEAFTLCTLLQIVSSQDPRPRHLDNDQRSTSLWYLMSIPKVRTKDAYAHLIDPEKFMWKPDDQDDMVERFEER